MSAVVNMQTKPITTRQRTRSGKLRGPLVAFNLTTKLEMELAEYMKAHGVLATQVKFNQVPRRVIQQVRIAHKIGSKSPGPPPTPIPEVLKKLTQAQIAALKVSGLNEAMKLTNLSDRTCERLFEHFGIPKHRRGKWTPERILHFNKDVRDRAHLVSIFISLNNTQAGKRFGFSHSIAATVRAELGLPQAKNGRSFAVSTVDVELPSTSVVAKIIAAINNHGLDAAKDLLQGEGIARPVVNRVYLEFVYPSEVSSIADEVKGLNAKQLVLLRDTSLTSKDVALRARPHISAEKVHNYRVVLGIPTLTDRDILPAALAKVKMTEERLRDFIECRTIAESAQHLDLSEAVVRKIRVRMGLPETPDRMRVSLASQLDGVLDKFGVKSVKSLRSKIGRWPDSKISMETGLTMDCVQLLRSEMGMLQVGRRH